MPVLIPAIAGVVVAGAKIFAAAKKDKADKAELARLKPSFYKIQDAYYQNRNIAESRASGGLDAADQFELGEGQRGLSSVFSNINQAGGMSVNKAGELLDSYNKNIRSIGVDSAEKQAKNIEYFMQKNKDLAGQQTTQWGVNEYAPYENKLKQLQQSRQVNQQNIWSGVGDVAGAISSYATGQQNQGMINRLFKNSDPYATGGGDAGYSAPTSQVVQGDTSIDTSRNLPAQQSLNLQFNQ